MAARIQTEFGNILIDNEVIARVAGLAAIECYGVVGMASINVKDGIVQLLLGDSLTKGIRVEVDPEGGVSVPCGIGFRICWASRYPMWIFLSRESGWTAARNNKSMLHGRIMC